MRLNKRQMEWMAFHLVKDLEEAGHLLVDDFNATEKRLLHLLQEEVAKDEALDAEAHAMLEEHKAALSAAGADYREAFLRMRKKLAGEKGII